MELVYTTQEIVSKYEKLEFLRQLSRNYDLGQGVASMSATQNSGCYWADILVTGASTTSQQLVEVVGTAIFLIFRSKHIFCILVRCIYVRGRVNRRSYKKFREWPIRSLEWLPVVLLMTKRQVVQLEIETKLRIVANLYTGLRTQMQRSGDPVIRT